MKKTIAVVSVIFGMSLQLFSQKVTEIGILGGTSYYMGDLNPSTHFYSPSMAYGGFFKYNLNPRYVLKTGFNLFKLKGSGVLPKDNFSQSYDFHTTLIDYNVLFEINFLPYDPHSPKENFTPFVNGGIGYSRITATEDDAVSHISLPFGLGCKLNISDEVDIGFEWNFHKTFNDLVDGQNMYNLGYEDSELKYSVHNNDWYSFFGLFITFKFINFGEKCPAYD